MGRGNSLQRWIITTTTALAVVLALGSASTAAEPYELDEVLANTRAALGLFECPVEDSGLILAGEGIFQGMVLTMTFAYDGEGRFILDGHGPISAAKGHDGNVTWGHDPSGNVRRLELGDRYHVLLPHWAISGYWLDAGSDLELSVDVKKSSRSEVALDILVKGTDFSATVWIDSGTWLPRSFTARDIGQDMSLHFVSYQGHDGRMLPSRLEMYDGKRRTGQMKFPDVTTVAGFPENYFARPEQTVEVRYIAGVPAQLEVRRGRWGHLFAKPLINGTDVGWFAIDTGAQATMIDRAVAVLLELPKLGDETTTGVGGQAKGEIRSIESIQIGPLRLDSIPLMTGNISSLSLGLSGGQAGLLGMDVLGQCVIVYDLGASTIALHDPETYELPRGEWQPLYGYNNQPTVRMAYEDHTGLFTIDTGNSGAVIFSPHTIKRLDLLDGRKTVANRIGGVGGSVAVRDGLLEWVEWGGRRIADVPAQFVQVDRGATADRLVDGVIGTDLLEHYVVVFDMLNGRIAYLPRI